MESKTTMARVTTLGVDHIGVGVTDMERSTRFWGELGFTEVAFDHSGPLPGLEAVSGREGIEARVVMLRPADATVLGPGAVKLVQTTDAPPPPMPEGMAWGEPGVCEVCIHAKDQAALYERLVAAGHTALMEPNSSPLDPYGTICSLSYVADPDGTKIELIEWLDLEQGWPQEPGPQGVNHVAFGVASLERTRDFYRRLGFTGMLFDSDGTFEPMDPWFESGVAPRMKMTLLTNPFGAGMEPVEHVPASPDMRGEWGHVGPFDFGIGVRNLDVAVRRLGELGIELRGEPQTVDLGDGASWRYAYFADPDDLYVCLTEARY
jgi:catechol 2,3-dioxygenase-like lactoylglutathione lyase family enzyme